MSLSYGTIFDCKKNVDVCDSFDALNLDLNNAKYFLAFKLDNAEKEYQNLVVLEELIKRTKALKFLCNSVLNHRNSGEAFSMNLFRGQGLNTGNKLEIPSDLEIDRSKNASHSSKENHGTNPRLQISLSKPSVVLGNSGMHSSRKDATTHKDKSNENKCPHRINGSQNRYQNSLNFGKNGETDSSNHQKTTRKFEERQNSENEGTAAKGVDVASSHLIPSSSDEVMQGIKLDHIKIKRLEKNLKTSVLQNALIQQKLEEMEEELCAERVKKDEFHSKCKQLQVEIKSKRVEYDQMRSRWIRSERRAQKHIEEEKKLNSELLRNSEKLSLYKGNEVQLVNRLKDLESKVGSSLKNEETFVNKIKELNFELQFIQEHDHHLSCSDGESDIERPIYSRWMIERQKFVDKLIAQEGKNMNNEVKIAMLSREIQIYRQKFAKLRLEEEKGYASYHFS